MVTGTVEASATGRCQHDRDCDLCCIALLATQAASGADGCVVVANWRLGVGFRFSQERRVGGIHWQAGQSPHEGDGATPGLDRPLLLCGRDSVPGAGSGRRARGLRARPQPERGRTRVTAGGEFGVPRDLQVQLSGAQWRLYTVTRTQGRVHVS